MCDSIALVDSKQYRDAIARFASGVTVVTTHKDGQPVGMTASAVSSVSLDPVLLLVCVSKKVATHDAIDQSGRFAVNVLGEGDGELAMRFATPVADRFAGVSLREGYDVPVLTGAIAHFVCEVHERVAGGDHTIYLGRVTACGFEPGARPLLYFGSRFGALAPTP